MLDTITTLNVVKLTEILESNYRLDLPSPHLQKAEGWVTQVVMQERGKDEKCSCSLSLVESGANDIISSHGLKGKKRMCFNMDAVCKLVLKVNYVL